MNAAVLNQYITPLKTDLHKCWKMLGHVLGTTMLNVPFLSLSTKYANIVMTEQTIDDDMSKNVSMLRIPCIKESKQLFRVLLVT